MKNIFLIIQFSSLCLTSKLFANMDFTLVTRSNITNYFPNVNWNLVKQIDYNLATVIFFSNGKYAIVPQTGKYAIIFNSYEDCETVINSKLYPVGLETDNYYEKIQDTVLNLEQKIKGIYDFIYTKIEKKEVKDVSDNDLIVLSKYFNTLKKQNKLDDNFIYSLDLFMLDYFKNKINGKWFLQKNFTLNVFYSPVVIDDEGNRYIYMNSINQSVISNQPLNLLYDYRNNMARYLKIPDLSNEHAKYINTGNF